MPWIPGKLLDEEGSWLIIVQDTNHCLSVINQPDSMFNIVFYHINIMVMNVYIRIFFLGGGGFYRINIVFVFRKNENRKKFLSFQEFVCYTKFEKLGLFWLLISSKWITNSSKSSMI